MIAEWLDEVTCSIGGLMNNALGIERSPNSDFASGITVLLVTLVDILIITVSFMVMHSTENRKENRK